MGRLGNNLFQIAQAFDVSVEYNRQMVIYRPDLKYENNTYEHTVFRAFQFTDILPENTKWGLSWPYKGRPTEYKEYYQSEKYFKKHSEMIKTLFGPPLDFVRNMLVDCPWLEERVSAISVRRGDYLNFPNMHPVVGKAYIEAVHKRLPEGNKVVVFSDDIPWCKENLEFEFFSFDGFDPLHELWIMSMCDDFAIANSTFSWWGAYLSRTMDKTVIAPQAWFANRSPDTWADIYCKGWEIQPSEFINGIIYPL